MNTIDKTKKIANPLKRGHLLLLLGCLLMNCCRSQSHAILEYKQLPMLHVENDSLVPLINHAIDYFDNMDVKPDSLFFTISTLKRPDQDFHTLLISSDHHRITIFNGYNDPIGFFYHNDYLFIVYNEESKQFFSTSNTKRSFHFDPHIKDKLQVIDDSQPYWYYYYYDGSFELFRECLPFTD